jgi:PAS domain S-box-containing protein
MLISRGNGAGKEAEFFTTMLRSIGDAVMTTDLDARITYVNPVAEFLTGWSGSEAEGRVSYDILELRHEVSDEPLTCPVVRVLRSGKETGYTNHSIVVARDGSRRTISYNAAPLRSSSGDLIGAVLIFHPSASKIEALRASDDRLHLLAKATNDAVWDLDLKLGKIWCNDAMTTLFGYTEDEIEDDPGWWLDRIHPQDVESVRHTLEEARAGSRYWQQEYRFRNRDGSYGYVLERGYVLRDAENCPIRMVGAVMDIIARRDAQEELMRLNDELEILVDKRTEELREANRELESFSFSVSHDLRSPLRTIIASSHLLEEEAPDALNDEAKDLLHRLVASAERMAVLIEDLLEYSRLARRKLKLQDVDLAAVSARVVEEIVQSQSECQAEVVVQELNMEARADPDLVRILLENLIENACKYSAKATQPRVEVGSLEQRGETVFFVRDNGVGFDPKYAHRLFQPFERLHSSDDYEGTGIGLANVLRIVHRHGGRVWAEGLPDAGATFFFTLG